MKKLYNIDLIYSITIEPEREYFRFRWVEPKKNGDEGYYVDDELSCMDIEVKYTSEKLIKLHEDGAYDVDDFYHEFIDGKLVTYKKAYVTLNFPNEKVVYRFRTNDEALAWVEKFKKEYNIDYKALPEPTK